MIISHALDLPANEEEAPAASLLFTAVISPILSLVLRRALNHASFRFKGLVYVRRLRESPLAAGVFSVVAVCEVYFCAGSGGRSHYFSPSPACRVF